MRKKFIMFLLIHKNALQVWSQEERTLTFQDAISIAVENNILIKQELNKLEISRSNKTINMAAFLPYVDMTSGSNTIAGRQFDQIRGEAVTTTVDRSNLSLNAGITLFNGFGRVNSVKQARDLWMAQNFNVQQTKQDVIYALLKFYLQILLDEKLVEISEENLTTQQIQFLKIQAYVDLGERPISDLYVQQADIKKLELLLLQAQNQLTNDKSDFCKVLQIDPLSDLKLKAVDASVVSKTYEEEQMGDLCSLAIGNRLDYKKLKYVYAASKKGVHVARSSYYPLIQFYYVYGSGYSSLQSHSFRTQLSRDNLYSNVGFNLSIPILQGFQTRMLVAKSKLHAENSKLDMQNTENIIVAQVKQGYNNYQVARKRKEVARSQFEATQKALELHRVRYDLGEGNLLDLSTANRNYIEACSDQIQAEYTIIFRNLMLNYFIGLI